MNEQWRTIAIVIATAAIGIITGLNYAGKSPAPVAPDPVNPVVSAELDLLPAFSNGKDRVAARNDAAKFGLLCDEIANMLMLDFGQPEAERRLTSGVQIAAFRRDVRWLAFDGISLSESYPRLAPAVADFLTTRVGTKPAKLTDEELRTWIFAMQSLGESARAAEKKL
jgi:hypothetical protein